MYNQNTLLTYPRTGTSWTQRRLRAFGKEYARQMGDSTIPKIGHTHAMYHPKHYKYGGSWEFQDKGKIFALVRDARQCVVSNWYWLRKHPDSEEHHHEEYETLERYVEYGAPRYADYLNWLNELDLEDYYFYEDIGTEEFTLSELPRMLGISLGFKLDEAGKEKLRGTTAAVVNLVGADHGSVPIRLLNIIHSVVQEQCQFKPYLERYCANPDNLP